MKKDYKSALESLLFIWSDEISIKKLANILEVTVNDIKYLIETLSSEYEEKNSGFRIITIENNVQLIANIENYEFIEKLGKTSKSKGLSKSTLETLTVIAYKQPVTKAIIDKIRGVKSDRAVQNLLEKNLIYEAGRAEGAGRPILYKTTLTFLKIFGLTGTKDLPPIETFEGSEILADNLYDEMDSDL